MTDFQRRFRRITVGLCIGALATLALGSCSDDVASGPGDCPDDQPWDEDAERCVPLDDDPADPDAGTDDVDDETDAGDEDDAAFSGCEPPGCEPVECDPDETPTTVTGSVHIPSGKLPLPDATVYIPEDAPDEITDGATCVQCEDELSATPLVSTLTDIDGEFRLDEDVPAGDEVPLVVEVGKWRRHTTLQVDPCQTTDVDPDRTRLPQNSDEGHIPKIAVTTGECDALECLMRKIGIDDAEFSTDDGDGRIHLFSGRGGTDRFDASMNDGAPFTDATQWWNDADNLLDYDILVHSCECDTYAADKQNAHEAFRKFTDEGGRAFLSHLHYVWLSQGDGAIPMVADWNTVAAPGGVDQSATGYIDDSFPKGQMLDEWMHLTGTTPQGEFDIYDVRGSVDSIEEELVQDWISIYADGSIFDDFFGGGDNGDEEEEEEFVQYFSFNTPLAELDHRKCGRVVFSDIHVSARAMGETRDISSPQDPFPTGCVTDDFSDQEKALVFMFFDLSSCIIPDDEKKGDW